MNTNANTWVNILDILWPVGSLYYVLQGSDNTPDTVLGGTWVQQNVSIPIGTLTFDAWYRIA